MQSIHKVRETQTELHRVPGSGIDTSVSVFKLFLGMTEWSWKGISDCWERRDSIVFFSKLMYYKEN